MGKGFSARGDEGRDGSILNPRCFYFGGTPLDNTFHLCNITPVEWAVEYTDEFETWWDTLGIPIQEAIDAKVEMLEERGPALGRPHVDTVRGSRHANMKELRVQSGSEPYRILFAFDPRRCAILLLGGCKTGQNRWYEEHIPVADRLYDEHLNAMEREEQGGR